MQLFRIPGGFVHQDAPLLPPDGGFQPPLPLGGFVAGIVLPLVGDALLVLLAHPLQLFLAILGDTHAQDDGMGGMAAVEGPDAPHKAVVQRLVFSIRVLIPLDWLMVRGAVVVGVDLPTVSAQVIVGPLGYLLLHQSKTAHDVAPDGGLQARMHAGFIINPADAPVRQVFGGLPDGGVVVRCSSRNLHESEVHTAPVGIPQRERPSVGVHHTECLGDVAQVVLRQLHGRRHNLLDRLILPERDGLHLRQTPKVVAVARLSTLGQHLPELPVGNLQQLFELLLDLPLGEAKLLELPGLILRRGRKLPSFGHSLGKVLYQIVHDGSRQLLGGAPQGVDLVRPEHYSFTGASCSGM